LTEPGSIQKSIVDYLQSAETGVERGVAESAEADQSATANTLRRAGHTIASLAGLLASGKIGGPYAGSTAYTGLTSDWERDPLGSAINTATAFVPIKFGQAVS